MATGGFNQVVSLQLHFQHFPQIQWPLYLTLSNTNKPPCHGSSIRLALLGEGWAWCKVFIHICRIADQSCKSIHVDSLHVSRLSSFMESRLQPGTPLQRKTTSIPFRTLSQALKNQTNHQPDAQEFYTDAQYGSDFGYYSTGRILHQPSAQDNFWDHAGVPYRHLVSLILSMRHGRIHQDQRTSIPTPLSRCTSAKERNRRVAGCTVPLGQRLH